MKAYRIEQEVRIEAPRAKVWKALLDVDGWWCHRLHEGSTERLEPHVGGRFFEEWSGGAALWGTVTFLDEPETLRLAGPLGGSGLDAVNTWEYALEEKGDATILKLSHRSYGAIAPGTKKDYDGGWKTLWKTLKTLAESGKRFRTKAR